MFPPRTMLNSRYEVLEFVGAGAEGDVYRALDHETSAEVALKLFHIRANEQNYHEKVQHVLLAASIRTGHPFVADSIECFRHEQMWALTSRWAPGDSLASLVPRVHCSLPTSERIRCAIAIAEGLHALHTVGVIHRDVKPANIVVNRHGQPSLVDFGVAHVRGRGGGLEGRFIGTPTYTSPEQILTPLQIDLRTDLFALGLVYWFLFTGRSLIAENEPRAAIAQITRCRFPRLSDVSTHVPPAVTAACSRLLRRDPQERFASARDVSMALGSKVSDLPAARLLDAATVCLACGAKDLGRGRCSTCRLRFGRRRHQLIFDLGPLRGRRCTIPEATIVVGRASLAPGDPTVSRTQFRIARRGDRVQIRNEAHVNQTYVGDCVALRDVLIHPADHIVFGLHRLEYQFWPN
jgi:serine/threonine protein kinase